MRKRTGEGREIWYYQYLLTNDIAFKEIKMYDLHHYFTKKYRLISEKFIGQDKQILKDIFNIRTLISIFEQLVDITILAFIIKDTFLKKILVGDTIAYIRCVSSIKSNISNLLSQVVTIYKNTLYINQLFEFLDMDTGDLNQGGVTIDNIESIEIVNLSYRYKNANTYALKNINLRIEKGDMLIIVGQNGSGKSTLIKILAGFYNDYEGEIYINHINLHNIDKTSLQKQIGILFQDFNKYELTVKENIGIGSLAKMNDDKILRNAMELANIDIKKFNLEKQLGFWFKDGIQLSGGEWIKIGISRAFIRNADLFILDEPNASLDAIAENKIFSSIDKLIEEKIGIIITHRVESIKFLSGRVVVINKGEIVDNGDHKELIERCSVYQELYNSAMIKN